MIGSTQQTEKPQTAEPANLSCRSDLGRLDVDAVSSHNLEKSAADCYRSEAADGDSFHSKTAGDCTDEMTDGEANSPVTSEVNIDSGKTTGYSARDVFHFVARYWLTQPRRFTLILVLITAFTFIETNLPNALSALFESIRTHAAAGKVWFYLGVFLASVLVFSLLRNINYCIYIVFESKIFEKLYNDAFAQVESLSEQYFVNTFTGSLIAAISRGQNSLRTFEDIVVMVLFPTVLTVVCSVILLAFRLPALALLLSVYLAALITGSTMLVLRYSGPAQAAYAEAQDRFGGHLSDCLTGIFTTKSYAEERREIEQFAAHNKILRNYYLEAYLRGAYTLLIQRSLIFGMLAILLGGGTYSFLQGKASIDDMAYLILAYTILQTSVQNVADAIKNLLTSSYDLHGVIALMREKPSIADKENAADLVVSQGEVRFEGVGFTYPGKDTPVFKDLSITIRPGERLALVGDSGGGKSTFVRLVQRLYDAQEGKITIDGQSVTDVTQASLRSAIAVVPQEPILFHRSIAENIAYGRPDSTLEEIRQAARQADIDQFVMSLPEQYKTLVGERGVKLSGGERQRVAIARAILADRKILILDEATSSLDSVSELAVQKAIQTVAHGRTAIMIAHRLSTIRDADRILVFKDGRIVEEGTHDDLSRKTDGVYASFLAIQSGTYQAAI